MRREKVTAAEVNEVFLYFLASNFINRNGFNPSSFRDIKQILSTGDSKYTCFLVEVGEFLEETTMQFGTYHMFHQIQISNDSDWPLKMLKDGLKRQITSEGKEVPKKLLG
jgi:hypothetical protein